MDIYTQKLNLRHSLARFAALQAGKILRSYYYSGFDVRFKGTVDPVTDADTESEKLVTDLISRAFPNDIVVAEELHSAASSAEHFWLIDPLDGTVNYSHKVPWFAVSIAYVSRDEPLIGVVYNPATGQMFSAVKGQGAFCNGERIAVSSTTELKRALVATGFPYNRVETRTNFAEQERMLCASQDVRRMGSASLDICLVAQGRFDAYYEFGLGPWDYAAGWVIALEAGAICSKPDGTPAVVGGNSFMCAAPGIANSIVSVITGGTEGQR
ncbi:MAG: inositol monophosphatase family protein [Planctomycetota bacterium]